MGSLSVAGSSKVGRRRGCVVGPDGFPGACVEAYLASWIRSWIRSWIQPSAAPTFLLACADVGGCFTVSPAVTEGVVSSPADQGCRGNHSGRNTRGMTDRADLVTPARVCLSAKTTGDLHGLRRLLLL